MVDLIVDGILYLLFFSSGAYVVNNVYRQRRDYVEYKNSLILAEKSMDEASKDLKENCDSFEKLLQAQTESIEMIKESLLLQKEGNELMQEILLVLKNSQ